MNCCIERRFRDRHQFGTEVGGCSCVATLSKFIKPAGDDGVRRQKGCETRIGFIRANPLHKEPQSYAFELRAIGQEKRLQNEKRETWGTMLVAA
jgi:hypothetical protein